MHHKFFLGDVIDCLKQIEPETVQAVITSPPYWGLRDYGVNGQIGLETTPEEFVEKMVETFREVNRVLRKDGTLWLNLGDTYAASGKGGGGGSFQNNDLVKKISKKNQRRKAVNGYKPKDLCGIPWRVALALQADGWYLRSDIIWSKPNPMPSSTKDRPTVSHEYLFLLSKRAHYYYDNEAIKEDASDYDERNGRIGAYQNKAMYGTGDGTSQTGTASRDLSKRNKRTVWEIATEPCPDAHFATFPRALVEPCILAGSSPKACPKCGAPWRRVLEPSKEYAKYLGKSYHDHANDIYQGLSQKKKFPRTFADYLTVDWEPTCKCDGNDGTGKCIVLDPFGGTGTVSLVAQALQRSSIYIDLKPEYLDMALERNGFNGLCHADTYEIIRVSSVAQAVNL